MANAIVILGASGDLAARKLLPALDNLFVRGVITKNDLIVGEGRTALTDDEFRAKSGCCDSFSAISYYHTGLDGLKNFISSKGDFEKIVIFMALPPHAYGSTAKKLKEEGFGAEVNLVVEKPFGYDFETAKELNKDLTQAFDESQIFRIDHYLAKEAVQNILVFRFANALFDPLWSHLHIESIQVNAYEEIGVEDRGAYFDSSGIVRDMVQNHLVQLLSLLTMEAPVTLEADDIRIQKLNLLRQLEVKKWCKYQVEGYRKEKGVDENSNTETYAAIELSINSRRWEGVPIYIRAGKYLNRKGTEIGVTFKKLPKVLFNSDGNLPANRIIFKIQPAEGIIVDLASKEPGSSSKITSTTMKFCYNENFEGQIPEAYTKLLQDAINGDKTLFVTAKESEVSWEKFDECIKDNPEPKLYRKGETPDPCFGENWINFEDYGAICE
jgi:glucose-6-phosphate 1-dehydrogenase